MQRLLGFLIVVLFVLSIIQAATMEHKRMVLEDHFDAAQKCYAKENTSKRYAAAAKCEQDFLDWVNKY